jgi:hypothetical protein
MSLSHTHKLLRGYLPYKLSTLIHPLLITDHCSLLIIIYEHSCYFKKIVQTHKKSSFASNTK